MKSILSLCAIILCLLCLCESMDRTRNKICYKAKTCIHNAQEKCGVDGQGGLRRFFDSCDILEYNCLKGTDYVKTLKSSCKYLPPIDDENIVKNGQDSRDKGRDTQNLEKPALEGEVTLDEDVIEGKIMLNSDEFAKNEEQMTIKGETGIEGDIHLNDEAIEGEINLNEEVVGETNLNNNEPSIEGEIILSEEALKGEIALNDDNSAIEGKVVLNNQESVIEGENVSDELVEGDLTLNDEEVLGNIKVNSKSD